MAIKVLHSHLAKSPDFVSRFKREAKSIGQLQHKNILSVIDFDIEDGTHGHGLRAGRSSVEIDFDKFSLLQPTMQDRKKQCNNKS